MNHILFAPSLLPCWRTSPAVGSEMAAIFPSFVPNRISTCPSLSSPATPRVALLRNSLLATPISLAPSRFFSRSNFRSSATAATVVFMLPTAKPELASTGKKPRWSLRSIKSFAMAELEARKLKYPSTGTEALLMGILVEGTSEAAKFLRANGITIFNVRDETVKVLGKSNMNFFSPEFPPLTKPAQRALDWAVDEQLKSAGEDGEITTAHILLGIWNEKESAGHKILASLGFDDEKASEVAKFAKNEFVMNYR
ncbi:ATP-dependent Clp protease ATP-binding subunit CLPT1, chloroplastic-like isoform X1 [Zingiber officinale]|uniref:ATP-dependent Clp protease ATP-binding subunit CLPT1, chloroplastic-like isoform X1 n=1 Tax=Zingiber officinale TaxID=94328 RepID=UPI001C4CC9CF|nr:ATP-dependent Clp protease ATP-binding subunit CLPT1, chloroplastic-like isoform X1 [Zingiber officinale]